MHPSREQWFERDGRLVLGVAARPLGGFPSAWRLPGAHADPSRDPLVLKKLAQSAERAGLDFLFLGDWFSTSAELAVTDPHLVARTEPLTTAGFLAAVTKRIGIVATVGAAYADPFSAARASASLDRLSEGRFGVNLVLGTEPRAALNYGRGGRYPVALRADDAHEYVEILRGLWDSWADDAFVADRATGALLSPDPVARLGHLGTEYSVAGPLSVPRPVQGHVPIVHAGTSQRSREFAAQYADVYVVDPGGLGEAVRFHRDVKALASGYGRSPQSLTIVAPLLPIVAETDAEAHLVYDTLVDGLLLTEGSAPGDADRAGGRDLRAFLRAVGLPLAAPRLEDVVSAGVADRFNPLGRHLVGVVSERSGRTLGGARPITYRHLLAAHLVPAPIVVGSPTTVADHLETWYRASAVDGFSIINAFLPQQSDAFLDAVVPELRRRELLRDGYEAKTLRGHLGLARPERRARAGAAAVGRG